jgi:regulatory protein
VTDDGPGSEALEAALRALRHRDRSEHELASRLAERGFADAEREHALAALRRTGLVDDERFARGRAASLAARGAGDDLVRHTLAEAGLDPGLVALAVESLEPELARARRIVAVRGSSPRTARYLRGRGYSYDVVAAAVASEDRGELR